MSKDSEEKERIIKLRVNEISLVDFPAIEEEFLITKRMEVGEMSEEKVSKPETQETETQVKKTDGEETQTQETKPETETTTQKKEETSKDENMEIVKQIQEVITSEKALNPIQAMAMLKKIGDMIAGAMGSEKGAKKEDKKEDKKDDKKIQKSVLTLTDEGEVIINPEALQDVAKGRRVFTTGRVSQMVDGLKSIINLVKEVDGEAYKSLFGELSVSESGIKKDESKAEETKKETPNSEEAITKALEKVLEPVTKRLTDLEATRGKVKGQGDQKTETVQKSAGDVSWSNIL